MKKILRILPVVALLSGIFGVASTKTDSIRADAVSIPSNQVLYLKPNAEWLQAGARYAAYFFTDGGGNEWKDLTKETGVLDIYKVIAPTTSYEKLIFTRMNPTTSENIWGNKWNQTGNLIFDGSKDLFTIPNGSWDGATTTWSVYDPLDYPLPPTFNAGSPVYFKPTAAFMTGATRLTAHFFIADGGATPQWRAMTQVDSGIYQVITPTTGVAGKEFDRIIFVSMVADVVEDAYPEFDWNYKVNQTTNLYSEDTNNLFDYSDLNWNVYVERSTVTLTATTEGISSDKVRIWVDRSGHYEEGYTWAMKIGTTLYQPTGFEKALKLTGSDRYFVYYDMPTSALTGDIGFSIVNSFLKVDVEIPALTYSAGDNNKIWKIDYVSATWSITKGSITERIYNTFFAKVLEGYLTCNPSVVNGYMAFNLVDTNFLPRASSVWNMEGDLSGNLIKDFVSESDYATGTRQTIAATDAFAKYEKLQTLYLVGSGTPGQHNHSNTTNTNMGLIAIISLLGLTMIAGFYFLKTKKQ